MHSYIPQNDQIRTSRRMESYVSLINVSGSIILVDMKLLASCKMAFIVVYNYHALFEYIPATNNSSFGATDITGYLRDHK